MTCLVMLALHNALPDNSMAALINLPVCSPPLSVPPRFKFLPLCNLRSHYSLIIHLLLGLHFGATGLAG